jgi:hypothetical protein
MRCYTETLSFIPRTGNFPGDIPQEDIKEENIMNRILNVTVVLFASSLIACASIQNQAALEKAAREHDFGYYFSSLEGRHDFDDLDSC